MAIIDKELDITKNIRLVDWLKSELLSDVSRLYSKMARGTREVESDDLADCLANIILISYILGRRLGIDYNQIGKKVRNKIRLGLIENHEVEKSFRDLSELSIYFDSKST